MNGGAIDGDEGGMALVVVTLLISLALVASLSALAVADHVTDGVAGDRRRALAEESAQTGLAVVVAALRSGTLACDPAAATTDPADQPTWRATASCADDPSVVTVQVDGWSPRLDAPAGEGRRVVATARRRSLPHGPAAAVLLTGTAVGGPSTGAAGLAGLTVRGSAPVVVSQAAGEVAVRDVQVDGVLRIAAPDAALHGGRLGSLDVRGDATVDGAARIDGHLGVTGDLALAGGASLGGPVVARGAVADERGGDADLREGTDPPWPVLDRDLEPSALDQTTLLTEVATSSGQATTEHPTCADLEAWFAGAAAAGDPVHGGHAVLDQACTAHVDGRLALDGTLALVVPGGVVLGPSTEVTAEPDATTRLLVVAGPTPAAEDDERGIDVQGAQLLVPTYLRAPGRVTLRRTATVHGSIEAGRLDVEGAPAIVTTPLDVPGWTPPQGAPVASVDVGAQRFGPV